MSTESEEVARARRSVGLPRWARSSCVCCWTYLTYRLNGAVWLLAAFLGAGQQVVAGAAVEAGGGQCKAVRGAHLRVASRRNATGHLLTSLRLAEENRLSAPLATTLLDVRTVTTRCKGMRTDVLDVTLEGPPPPPSPGYTEFQGQGYYKVHGEQMTWEQAKITCETEDAHLLILNSDAEAEVIRQAVKQYTNVSSYITIGAHDKDIEGHYVTIFGETLAVAGYQRWKSGDPDGKSGQNCLVVDKSTIEILDAPCERTFSFVCEQTIA